MKEGLKPSLATTHAKASERVIADPPGWERGRGDEVRSVFRAAGKAELRRVWLRLAQRRRSVRSRILRAGNAGEGDEVRPVFRAAGKAELRRVWLRLTQRRRSV